MPESSVTISGIRTWDLVKERGGGLGRNRTTDTRIFSPAREVSENSLKSKKRNDFSLSGGAAWALVRTGVRTSPNFPPASPCVFSNEINAIGIPAKDASIRTHVLVQNAVQGSPQTARNRLPILPLCHFELLAWHDH